MINITKIHKRISNINAILNNLSDEEKQSLNDWIENDENGDLEPDLNHFADMVLYWKNDASYTDFVEKYMK